MRPRDALNRRKKLYLLVVGISFGAMIALAFLDKYLPPMLFKILSYGAIAVFAAGILLVYVGIRCPKCKAILGLKFVYSEETLDRCSRCGVNFDDDL